MTELTLLSVIIQVATLLALLSLGLIASYYFKWQAVELELARAVLEDWAMLERRKFREAKAAQTLVPDPLAWASAQLADGLGFETQVTAVARAVPAMRAVELIAADGRRVVISPLSARAIKQAQSLGKGHLAAAYNQPLINGRRPVSVERTLLSAGDYFDLEAEQAGQRLNVCWAGVTRLWFHVLPPLERHAGPREARVN